MSRKKSEPGEKLYSVKATVYCLHKNFFKDELQNGTIRIGRIKSYQKKAGEVIPLIIEVGAKAEIGYSVHEVTDNWDEAFRWLTTGKK